MYRVVVAFVWVVLALPAPAAAWGFEAHRFIMDRAIALLPAEIRPLFERTAPWSSRGCSIPTRGAAPDLGRRTSITSSIWTGKDTGSIRFAELPRDYTAAVARFGKARIEENGAVPWRVEEYHGILRRAFESYARRGTSGRFDLLLFSAALAHYVADAYSPFHTVVNDDGQLTGQHGIHARFKSSLFEQYPGQVAKLRLKPPRIEQRRRTFATRPATRALRQLLRPTHRNLLHLSRFRP